MTNTTHTRRWTGRTFLVLAGLIAVVAIAWLATNVSREMQILRSAQSDNAQWSLAQTEVEFLDFVNAASNVETSAALIRRRFDIFYSRIRTIEVARVYTTLRQNEEFLNDLTATREFLDEAVMIIDLTDPELKAQQSTLDTLANEARVTIRALSNRGLAIFAANADEQRRAVALTMAQLAVALTLIIAALGLAIVYLRRLNEQNVQRERAQKEIATRMNRIIETSLDGMIVTNANGEVVEFNNASETIFGYSRKEAIGKDLNQFIDGLDLPAPSLIQDQSIPPHPVVGTGRLRSNGRRKNGVGFPLELSIQSALSDGRTIYVAFLRDVSNTVMAEQNLVKARDAALAGEKLKTNFLSTMSHEIRTPLNGLLGNLSLIQETDLSAQQNKYIQNMETSGRLLMSHISDVLDITRYDAGKLSIHLAPMNLSILLQDIVDSQTATALAARTKLTWEWHGPARDWVLTDPDRVQLILINLIGNAVKFTQAGTVKVTARVLTDGSFKDHVEVRIVDTGTGIPDDLKDRIFDDFVTGNPAYDRDVGGTGLGLSIAKRFAMALGGSIGVHSKVGEGSTFFVILPMPEARKPALDFAPRQIMGPQRQLSILLVEDNDINRIVAREMLEAGGHIVTEADNGQTGVQKAAATRFDVIFMDISMPVMDGRTATREIRNGGGKSAETPIVALTAHVMADDQEQFARDGMIATLTKPLSKRTLFEVLNFVTQSGSILPDGHLPDLATLSGLKTRFIDETEEFLEWANTEKPAFNDLAAQAHKMAGSAATFQTTDLAASFRALASMARLEERDAADAILEDLPRVWSEAKATLTASVS